MSDFPALEWTANETGEIKLAVDPALEEKPFRLVKSFSLIAILLIFATVLSLAALLSHQAEVIITRRVEDDTVKLMDNLNNQMYFNFLLVVEQLFGGVHLGEEAQRELLSRVINYTIYGFDIKQVRIYDLEGHLTFTTDDVPLLSPADDLTAYRQAVNLALPRYQLRYNPLENLPRWRPPGKAEKPAGNGFELSFPSPDSKSAPRPPEGTASFPLLEEEERVEQTPPGEVYKLPGDIYQRFAGPAPTVKGSGNAYLERLRALTVHRYEGGRHLFLNFFPQGDFVLRSYKALDFYQTREISGVLFRSKVLSGVLEVSRDLTQEYRQIARLQYFALSMAALLALVLTVALRLVVSRGEAIITKRNLERQALRERLDQAERLAGLGSMVATVAHEIRNPLGIIHSTADLLSRFLKEEPEKVHFAAAIVEEANRLSEIVSEFLDFARPPVPRLTRVVVEEILEEILAFLEVTLARASVEVRTDFRREVTPTLADAGMLHRAFLNLLLNAVQAMDEGGLLTVSTCLNSGNESGDRLVVIIKDTGPGLTPEVAKKIFAPFFTTKARGTGLGLVIVRNIIEAHGGEIGLSNGSGGDKNDFDPEGPGLVVTIRLKI